MRKVYVWRLTCHREGCMNESKMVDLFCGSTYGRVSMCNGQNIATTHVVKNAEQWFPYPLDGWSRVPSGVRNRSSSSFKTLPSV